MKSLHRYLFATLLALALVPLSLPGQEIYEYNTGAEHIKPKSRELFFYGMRAYPFGKIPQFARQKALGQMEKMERARDSYSVLAESSWRQIGPLHVAGRVRSIAVHPTDGKTLWIGAADGGVWKSTDRGASWTPQMQTSNAIAMGALAVDPSNPDILYAGTGEMSSNIDAYTGAGMFKSEDGGETWRVIGLTTVGSFARIVVHPTNGQIVWAGATKNNKGFYKSTDGGETWRRITEEAVSDVTVNPQNPNELWLALMSNGIRHSTDGGETFTRQNNGLGPNGTTIDRMSVQVYHGDPSILYAVAYETIGSGEGQATFSRIYKSTNGGQGWNLLPTNNVGDFFSNGAQSQGWYNNVICVKPDDPNVVIAGGVRMVRTANGGEQSSSWSYTGLNTVHPDHHAMAFDPTNPDRLYEGNDGGMYISEDGGANWTKISNGLAITQFYAMKIDQREENITYGGTQDNGTLRTDSDNYGDVLGGDGFAVAIDYSETATVYAERERGQIYRMTYNPSLQIWQSEGYLSNGIPVGDEYVNWYAPLVLDPQDNRKLYSGRDQLYLALSPDNPFDPQWQRISPEMAGNISAIGISPHTSETIYIGSAQGMVMRSTNSGQEWTDLTFGHGLPNRAVTDFAFSGADPNTVYVSYSGFYTEHIFRSTDGGETWSSISKGLPDIPFNTLTLHPEDDDVIFAGSDIGMFLTVDGGTSWTVYNEGLPRVAVIDLEIHVDSKTLRAATHGRSMFEIGLAGDIPKPIPSITSPIGGEVWVGTTPNIISWGGFEAPNGVRVEYSLDDGDTWRTLAENVQGNFFRWNTVNKETFLGRIRVTAEPMPGEELPVSVVSNTFSIVTFGKGSVITTDSKPTVPYGIAFDGEYLWTTDFNSNRLLKLDPVTLDAIEEITMEGVAGDSLFTGITYYPPRSSFFVHRLNGTLPTDHGGVLVEVMKDGTVRGVWQSPCDYPIGLAWLGGKNPDIQYLYASDRNGLQPVYFFDPTEFNPSQSAIIPIISANRMNRIESGPRGSAAGAGYIWQVTTDFTGGTVLQDAVVSEEDIVDLTTGDNRSPNCKVELSSPLANTINARGVELDDDDKALWISDFGGNIYKIAACETPPGVSDSGYVSSSDVVTGNSMPEGVTLTQNMPNPFGSSTEISFTLPRPMQARLVVFDMQGRQISTLADGRFESGTQTVQFRAKGLPAGIYRYSLLLENGSHVSRTMVFVK